MYNTYVLYSASFDKIYVGQSGNLNQRLETHNSTENTGWTFRYRPWILIYEEEFNTREEAISREKQLKSAKGRLFIRGILNERNF